jgi:Rod binding domain-containing protein
MRIGTPNGLNGLISEPKKTDDPRKIGEAASQFEALLIKQMLQSARPEDGDEDQNSTLLDLGDQQFAQALASRGGLGIAKMVIVGLNQNANR